MLAVNLQGITFYNSKMFGIVATLKFLSVIRILHIDPHTCHNVDRAHLLHTTNMHLFSCSLTPHMTLLPYSFHQLHLVVSLFLPHRLNASLSHSLTHSLTLTLSRTHMYSLSNTHTHSLDHSLTRSLTHSVTHSLTRSLTYTHTHTHTHSLSLSLSLLTHSLSSPHSSCKQGIILSQTLSYKVLNQHLFRYMRRRFQLFLKISFQSESFTKTISNVWDMIF